LKTLTKDDLLAFYHRCVAAHAVDRREAVLYIVPKAKPVCEVAEGEVVAPSGRTEAPDKCDSSTDAGASARVATNGEQIQSVGVPVEEKGSNRTTALTDGEEVKEDDKSGSKGIPLKPLKIITRANIDEFKHSQELYSSVGINPKPSMYTAACAASKTAAAP